MALLLRIKCWLKRLAWLVGFILLVILITAFSRFNADPVVLHLFEWMTPTASLAAWLLLFFIAGGICGLASSSLLITRLMLRRSSLERKLERRRVEIHNLKQQALSQLEDK